MVFTRPPDPLEPPQMPGVRRCFLRLHGGGLALCLAGVVGGIFLQRAHYRGQAGLILALLSGMLGVVFALSLLSLPPRDSGLR
jgi:hypothetical protein